MTAMQTPPQRPRLPTHQRVLLALGALLIALIFVDGRRGALLSSDRGDVQHSPTARGSAVYIWGGGGYQGGK